MSRAAVEKANRDLNKDKLPWPYRSEIVFTDGGKRITARSPERRV